MTDLYVDQLLSTPVRSVTPKTALATAATELVERDVGALVVLDDDRLAGILTATDVVRVTAGDGDPSALTVADAMRTDVVTTTRDAPVGEVAATMVDRRIHHVPVVDDEDRLVGMITTMDLATYLADRP